MKNKKLVMQEGLQRIIENNVFGVDTHEDVRHILVDVAIDINGDEGDYASKGYGEIMKMAWELMDSPEYKMADPKEYNARLVKLANDAIRFGYFDGGYFVPDMEAAGALLQEVCDFNGIEEPTDEIKHINSKKH